MPKPKLGVYMKLIHVFAAASLIATAAFADNNFHVGARFAAGYDMVWNVDNSISTNDIMKNLGAPESELPDEQVIIKDMDKLGGIGLSFGLSFLYQATPVFGIQPELLFSYRGRSVEPKGSVEMGQSNNSRNNYYDDDDFYYYYDDEDYYGDSDLGELGDMANMGGVEIELSQWYFEIPLLIRLQTGSGLFFNVGPVLSINMSSEVSLSIMTADAEDYTATAVFGALAGLGYSINLGNGQMIDLDFRFQMGFTSLVKDDIEIPGEDIKLDGTKILDPKDFNFSLGIAYWFI